MSTVAGPRRQLVAFAGPSLPVADRPDDPHIRWLPPAGRGDLAALEAPAGSVIALIDGYMVRRHPPSPTEVHALARRGFTVWGCSSLGALRAVELRNDNVRGFGWVYRRVLDGTITYDDELVAVLDPRTDRAATVFLVNIRRGLETLVLANTITRTQAEEVIGGLRAVHYEQRTTALCRTLAAEAGIGAPAIERLLSVDIKRTDALGLLTHLCETEDFR